MSRRCRHCETPLGVAAISLRWAETSTTALLSAMGLLRFARKDGPMRTPNRKVTTTFLRLLRPIDIDLQVVALWETNGVIVFG